MKEITVLFFLFVGFISLIASAYSANKSKDNIRAIVHGIFAIANILASIAIKYIL